MNPTPNTTGSARRSAPAARAIALPLPEDVAADREFPYTRVDFERVQKLIYQRAGIALGAGKQNLVYSRLSRRLRATGIPSFSHYLDRLESDPGTDEWEAFTNALTTNLTAFFREDHHFPILLEHLRAAGARRNGQPLTIWCCASSTGEEPYSIAITACEAFNTLTPPVRIIASDIDTNVLRTAEAGVYPMERVQGLSQDRLRKFFQRGTGPQSGHARVRGELRGLVSFQRLNLLAPQWSVPGDLSAIFCRNVLIYFDRETQAGIVGRFAPLLGPAGLLFAGHSESLAYAREHFHLRGKTVYDKVAA